MKNNINQNTRKLQNLDNKQTVKRINRMTKTFRNAGSGQRERMLKTLATEINSTQNNAVRNWLVKFDTILRSMEVAK